jgi:transposase-like protein
VIQRCQVHKRRNLKAHVPEKHWAELERRLSEAYQGYRPDGAADNSVIQPVKVRSC